MSKVTFKDNWELIVGLEVHAELATRTKLFCGCLNEFGNEPNTNVCPVCLGLPGSLPVVNEQAVYFAMRLGEAVNCSVNRSVFARKNYFYPDMPKDYQISQYDLPTNTNGYLDLPEGKRIGIERAHIEEDTGKTTHKGESGRISGADYSLVDYNRAGVALAEIVSKPDLRTGREAAEYAAEIRRIMRYLGVSDGNMQEGSLRCDVNISVRPTINDPFGTKVEIKNMNSFSAIQKACEYEIKRQIKAYESGEEVKQETRLWDEGKQLTKSMRSKEGSSDYRYFPDPDLGPIEVSHALKEKWRSELPELPAAKRNRYAAELGLSIYDARVLTDESSMAKYFEKVVNEGGAAKSSANWITGDLAAYIKSNRLTFDELHFQPSELAEMLKMIDTGEISGKIAKEILPELLSKGGSPKQLVQERGLGMIGDPKVIEEIIDQLIIKHPNEVESFRSGKKKLLGFFVGQLMKETKGKADPKLANQILNKKLQG